MKEYHKIQSIFKRDERTHKFIPGAWTLPEFEYLQDNLWIWTEKVDGTNIRIGWDGTSIEIGGRTANAQIPTFLYAKLQEIFSKENFKAVELPENTILYGEGYGAKIQKGGGNYNPSGVNFVLFDVTVGEWWLQREDVEDIGRKVGVEVVPVVGAGGLNEAIKAIRDIGLQSTWGDFQAEGIVLRPKIELFKRSGGRIITKIKHKDF